MNCYAAVLYAGQHEDPVIALTLRYWANKPSEVVKMLQEDKPALYEAYRVAIILIGDSASTIEELNKTLQVKIKQINKP